MARQTSPTIGVRIPTTIIRQIDIDIDSGEFSSRSDWIREAVRDFYRRRVEQNNTNRN